MPTYFQKHLYFDADSREYQLGKCMKVLEMIARVKDKIDEIEQHCIKFYGFNEYGRLQGSESDNLKYAKNKATLKRLKSYYNYCLTKINKL